MDTNLPTPMTARVYVSLPESMDWFKGKSTPETHGFWPSNWMGFPVKIFPSSNSMNICIIYRCDYVWPLFGYPHPQGSHRTSLTSILAPFVVHLQGQGCSTRIPAFIAVHLLPTLRWIWALKTMFKEHTIYIYIYMYIVCIDSVYSMYIYIL